MIRKAASALVAIVALLAIAAAATALIRYEWISKSCDEEVVATIRSSPHGSVARSTNTYCAFGAGYASETYTISVASLKGGWQEVFKISETSPSFVWKSNTELEISVPRPSYILGSKVSADDVVVSYAIPKAFDAATLTRLIEQQKSLLKSGFFGAAQAGDLKSTIARELAFREWLSHARTKSSG